jgi:hypothetical protein
MDFTVYMPILNNVPSKHRAAVLSIITALEHLSGQLGPVLVFVTANLPAILALFSGGFSVQAILALLTSLLPLIHPPTPA